MKLTGVLGSELKLNSVLINFPAEVLEFAPFSLWGKNLPNHSYHFIAPFIFLDVAFRNMMFFRIFKITLKTNFLSSS